MNRWCLALLLTLFGCGGSEPPATPTDSTLERERNAGQSALTLERPTQAIDNYKAALVRAQLRDDPDAIGDMGFNLAVAQLRAGLPKDALATTHAIRAELTRRGVTVPPALDLAEATGLYRTGDKAGAARLAQSVRASTDKTAAARAAFLLGLIADEANDLTALREARTALPAAGADETGTDAAELDARIALRSGQWAEARAAADRVARSRRDLLDYRGLARALALEAAAAAGLGDRDAAADLFLRAGRSAASQDDRVAARDWLGKAIVIGRDPEVLGQARNVLTALAAK